MDRENERERERVDVKKIKDENKSVKSSIPNWFDLVDQLSAVQEDWWQFVSV